MSMAKYYTIISTDVVSERESFYLESQLPEKRLSIGWGRINPMNLAQQQIKEHIELMYPEFLGTVNPDNGARSLELFLNLRPGAIVFVRGTAQIIDVVVITGAAFFDTTGHYQGDYYLKVPFTPLFSDFRTIIKTADIPPSIYNEVLYDGGRYLAARELTESTARALLKAMVKNL
jgi:hypothetical protein